MRRAMPYPCCGPMALRVLRTMRASVPCQTSAFVLILASQMRMAGFLWEGNRGEAATPAEAVPEIPMSIGGVGLWPAMSAFMPTFLTDLRHLKNLATNGEMAGRRP